MAIITEQAGDYWQIRWPNQLSEQPSTIKFYPYHADKTEVEGAGAREIDKLNWFVNRFVSILEAHLERDVWFIYDDPEFEHFMPDKPNKWTAPALLVSKRESGDIRKRAHWHYYKYPESAESALDKLKNNRPLEFIFIAP